MHSPLMMTWRNIWIVFAREIRDQLRDRRTIFMVAVLPVLLYPLLGMIFFQLAQVMGEKPSRILVIGAREPLEPPLFDETGFVSSVFVSPQDAVLLKVEFLSDEVLKARAGSASEDPGRALAEEALRTEHYDAVLYFPPGFAAQLADFREGIRQQIAAGLSSEANSEAKPGSEKSPEEAGEDASQKQQPTPRTVVVSRSAIPSPRVYYSTANDRSQTAYRRLVELLDRWTDQVMVANLAAARLPPDAARPFVFETADVAVQSGFRGAAVWAKILPILLVMWALTGAFYPAVDLCAGEKERGTLETLLSSPARRSEIVLGKLGAITVFSMVTAVLNLISMGLTGWLAFGHLPDFAAPPLFAIFWLAVALLPVSLVFSCLALGIAAFARSTKEGQYYLLPLLFCTLPLVGVPMARGSELDLGTALVPITGLVLLLKTMIEGQMAEALRFVFPVGLVTLGGCYFALRWAVYQFNSETVLFRESERFHLVAWLRHIFRQRAVPSGAAALTCGLAILLIRFLLTNILTRIGVSWNLVQQALISQLVVILLPVVVLAALLTREIRATFLLRLPSWRAVIGAALLAVMLHPAFFTWQQVIIRLYPLDPVLKESLKQLTGQALDLRQLLLVMALLPAICEELAFRGFILTGFRSSLRPTHALIFAALFFALGHTILQQSMVAFAAGLILGVIAIQTGSLLPCVIYHAIHNALLILQGSLGQSRWVSDPWIKAMMTWTDEGPTYHLSVVVFGILAAGLIFAWMISRPEVLRSYLAEEETGSH